MQRATESLEQEHRTIEKILRVIGVLADELAENRYMTVTFFRIYANSWGSTYTNVITARKKAIFFQCLKAMVYRRRVVRWARCGTSTSGHEP